MSEFLDRISSRELSEQMAFDTLEAEDIGREPMRAGRSAAPSPAHRIALRNRPTAEIFADLDRYWPPA